MSLLRVHRLLEFAKQSNAGTLAPLFKGHQWGLQVRPNEQVVDTELHLGRHMHC